MTRQDKTTLFNEGSPISCKAGILRGPGARFSKLPIITGPVKVFCFPFQMRVSEGLKTVQ